MPQQQRTLGGDDRQRVCPVKVDKVTNTIEDSIFGSYLQGGKSFIHGFSVCRITAPCGTYDSFRIDQQQVLGRVVLHAGQHVLALRAGRFAHQKVAIVLQQMLGLCPADAAVVPRFRQQLRPLNLGRDGKWF